MFNSTSGASTCFTSLNYMRKEIVIIGLGKMGGNVARRLTSSGWKVVGYNRSPDDTKTLEDETGLKGAYSFKEIAENTSTPRVIWLMIPAGDAIDKVLFGEDGLTNYLDKGDIIIDSGNSYYKDSIERSKRLAELGIKFTDVGFSGGPTGALRGGSLMVGGSKENFEYLSPLLTTLALPSGVQHFEGVGAGHFVKMVHNGIEYGMMQAIAEGFTLLKGSRFNLNLEEVADIYNHGSVVESRLVGWLEDGFKTYGEGLDEVSGSVAHTGEGEWTVKEAKEQKVEVKVIEDALNFRIESEKEANLPVGRQGFTGKLLSAMRNRFGGHSIKK